TGVADAGVADAGVAEAGIAEAGIAEAGIAEAGIADEQADGGAHAHDEHAEAAPPEQITAFFLGARTRIATLQLQREINTYEAEPTMAILPGVALAEMWRGVGYA